MVEQFNYTVRMNGDLQALGAGPMVKVMANTSELVVSSAEFDDYEKCVEVASRLLSTLCSAITRKNGRTYVIVSKKNPLFDDPQDDTSTEGWDRLTVVRLYGADAEVLKEKSVISCLASADIKVAEHAVDVIKGRVPQVTQ